MKKLKYKKPRCDCGKFLTAIRTEYWTVERPITVDGRLSLNTIKIGTGYDSSDYEIELYCSNCGKSYDCDYDEEDRIVRGDLKKPFFNI